MKRRNDLETIAGRVNADGTIAAGDGFTVSRVAAGNYTVTFTPGFRLVAVTVTGTAFNVATVMWVTDLYAASSVRILSYNNASTPFDNSFAFIAVGIQL